LKGKHDKLLSKFAFNCNLRHYTKEKDLVQRLESTLIHWCGLTPLDPGFTPLASSI